MPQQMPSAPAAVTPLALTSSFEQHVVQRQLFWLATGFIVVSGCLVLLALSYMRTQAIQAGERLTESFAHVIEEQTTRTFQTVDQRLQLATSSLAQLEKTGGLNEQTARALLREQLKELPFVHSIWILDAQGRIQFDSDEGNMGANLADHAYFQIYRTHPQTGFHIGLPVRSRTTAPWFISASRPLTSAGGAFSGVIVASMESPYFDKLWRSIDLGAGGSIALFSRDGTLMMRSPPAESAIGKSFRDRPIFKDYAPKDPIGSYLDASAIDGTKRLLSYRVLPNQPDLLVLVGQSHELVLAPWRSMAILALFIWLVAAAAITGLCILLGQTWLKRIRAEAQSRQLTQRLTLATDSAHISIWEWDHKADHWEATPTYFRMLGHEPEEGFVNNAVWIGRIHLDDRAAVSAALQKALDGHDVAYTYEARLRHADGSFRWVQVVGRVIAHDAQGKAARSLGVTTDITERKQAEETLRLSEARYRELFESNPHPMWVYDLETLDFQAVNDSAIQQYGYSREEFLAMTIRDIRPPEDVSALVENVRSARAGLSQAELWRHHRKDGSIILVEITAHSLVFGNRASRLIFSHDVTERHHAQEKLRLSEENLAITLQSIGDAVIATDAAGLITRMNPTAERLTGWLLADAAGLPLNQVFHIINAQTRALAVNPVELVMTCGDVVGLANHTALLARDGCEYQIFDSAAPIRSPTGEIVGVVLVFSDVTEAYQVREDLARTAELLERTGELAHVGGWEMDLRTQHLSMSREALRINDLDPAETPVFKEGFNLYDDDVRPVIQAAVQKAINDGTSFDLELPRVTAKGRSIWVRTQGRAVFEGEKAIKLQGAFQDITARKLAEQQLAVSQEALRESALHTQTILDNLMDGVITIDTRGRMETFNKAASHIFGYEVDEVIGHNVSMLMPEPRRSQHDGFLMTLQTTGQESAIGKLLELEGQRKDGSLFHMSLQVTQMSNAGTTTFIGIVRDITQNRKDVEEIRRLAFYDPLTGLPNRRLLMDRLKQAMITSARTAQHGALMFLDLDHFKQLNDTLGHDVGDVLLQQVSVRLQACVREGDSVARLGGDEFVILLEALSPMNREAATQAEVIATKVLDAFGQSFSLRGHAYDSTPSIGIVVFMGGQDSIDNLLKKADVAMYQAKAAGRNAARFFDPAMQAVVAAHDALEKDLRHALAAQEFMLHYQIQVDKAGNPIGAEALVRWRHPRRGMVTPAQFIPMAEETGMILPLGQWVLETACEQLVHWANQPATAHWTMAVNVSAFQFAQDDYVATVAAALEKTGANALLLKLELTESMLVNDVEDVIAKMNDIKAFGVGFSLDDFGTGYSSLSHLKRLSLDQLKIDQTFVRDILTDSSDAVIARTIVALGHSLGLKVIAEGVETAAQRDFLASMGCDAFQGYYFGRPVPARDLSRFENNYPV